jgi:glycosyltransferase involved in cell wall biosynthesis
MKKYKVSIAILNYNREEFLDRSIRSCLNQEFFDKEVEIIVIDDASTDKSDSVIRYFKKNYICDLKYFKLKKNKGPGYCSKLAVQKSKGDFFIRVDSDDYIGRLAIENMSDILINNPDISYVYGDLIKINHRGLGIEFLKLNTKSKRYNHGAGIMFRKDVITKVGNYNPNLREAEDFDLLRKIDKKFKSFYLPIPFYRYYIHGKNVSLKGNRKNIIKTLKQKK